MPKPAENICNFSTSNNNWAAQDRPIVLKLMSEEPSGNEDSMYMNETAMPNVKSVIKSLSV